MLIIVAVGVNCISYGIIWSGLIVQNISQNKTSFLTFCFKPNYVLSFLPKILDQNTLKSDCHLFGVLPNNASIP